MEQEGVLGGVIAMTLLSPNVGYLHHHCSVILGQEAGLEIETCSFKYLFIGGVCNPQERDAHS